MAGHSKWSKIKRKKAATDAKRGKLFTRLLREIQVAAKMGGPNVADNPRLKLAVQNAKSMSVPQSNIERAISRGSGSDDGAQFEEVVYEGYGPGGVAILVKTLTDNKNRTVAEVRHAFTKCNGSLASTNSVAYLFQELGIITVPKTEADEEAIMDTVLDAGAEDVVDEGDVWEVTVQSREIETVRAAVEGLTEKFEAEVRSVPETMVQVTGKDAQNVLRLLEMLDDLDDVQNVETNFDVEENELEALDAS